MKYLIFLLILFEIYLYLKTLKYEYINSPINSMVFKHPFFRLIRKIDIASDQVIPNIYVFFYLSVIVFIFTFYMVYCEFLILLPSILIGLLGSMLPYIYISVKYEKTNDLLTLEVTKFISKLSQYATIKQDIYYCFEKSVDGTNGYLKNMIEDFLVSVKYEGYMDDKFDRIILKTENELLRNLMINLKQAAYSRGDLVQLISRLEEESYKLYSERERRKFDTHFSMIAIYFSMFVILLITYIFYSKESIRVFYFETVLGNYLISFFIILFLFGIVLTIGIRKFNY